MNILLISGTSSVAHLREHLDAAELALPGEVLARLDAIGGEEGSLSGLAGSAPSPRA